LNEGTHGLVEPLKKRWRIGTDYMISKSLSFNSRMEFVWISLSGTKSRQGFLGTAGFTFRKSGLSGNISVTLFDTQDYDTRIYIYEPDVLYNFSLPAFFGRGFHYYINLHKDFSHLIPGRSKHFKLSGWLKWSQTYYPGSVSIGSGLDEITCNRKSEIKTQILIQWQ
jgi:hypothetical protein